MTKLLFGLFAVLTLGGAAAAVAGMWRSRGLTGEWIGYGIPNGVAAMIGIGLLAFGFGVMLLVAASIAAVGDKKGLWKRLERPVLQEFHPVAVIGRGILRAKAIWDAAVFVFVIAVVVVAAFYDRLVATILGVTAALVVVLYWALKGRDKRGASVAPPDYIAIDPDDYHAKHVGRTAAGHQFFLTTPFVPETREVEGDEFVALFLFDASGALVEARIDGFGPRASLNQETLDRCYQQRLRELGSASFERITVKPFTTEQYGTTFGLIPSPPGEPGEGWTVELQPGNYMAFHEPWDSGEYDT